MPRSKDRYNTLTRHATQAGTWRQQFQFEAKPIQGEIISQPGGCPTTLSRWHSCNTFECRGSKLSSRWNSQIRQEGGLPGRRGQYPLTEGGHLINVLKASRKGMMPSLPPPDASNCKSNPLSHGSVRCANNVNYPHRTCLGKSWCELGVHQTVLR